MKITMKTTLLDIPVESYTKRQVLEKIEKYLSDPSGFFHITSLNPENFVLSDSDEVFKKVVTASQIKIIDGVGVVVAGRVLGLILGPRYSGVDLMTDLLSIAHERRLRVMLIGGRPKIAEKIVECQRGKFFEAEFFALEGISDIKHPTQEEEKTIFSIVARYKPHFLFVAFGSSAQELWLYNHRSRLEGIVCMGVGGAFDYLSGEVVRAPQIVRNAGLEWFVRLLRQPWRIRRQTKLLTFVKLIVKERFAR